MLISLNATATKREGKGTRKKKKKEKKITQPHYACLPPPSSHIFSLNLQMRGYAVLPFRQPSPPCDLFLYEAVKFSDICRKKSFDFAPADTSRCESVARAGNSRNFKSLILSDLHPCQACEKEPKSSLRFISKINSTHTSTGGGASTSSAWGVDSLSPPQVFWAWNNKAPPFAL